MADGVIDEIAHTVLELRKTSVHPNTMRRWASHLRDEVQPQLEELATLKAAASAKKKTPVSA